MADDNNIHKGHRKRMLEKFSKFGIDVFNEHEKLEMLLYLIIPRKNTNIIAHNLIKEFGSINDMLAAPLEELQKIEGIGMNAALQLKFIGALINHLNHTPVKLKESFTSAEKVAEYCINHFNVKTNEVLALMLLDDKYSLLQTHDISSNRPNHITADCREIIEQILKYDTRKVIIAHNHLNGTAYPSDDDIRQTREIGGILRVIDVGLVDHIIVFQDNAISLRNNGLLNDVWER